MSSDPPASAYCFSSRSVNQAACSARGDTPFLYSRSNAASWNGGLEGPAGFPAEESQSGISWRSTGVLWLWPPEKGPPRVDSCGSLVKEKETEAEKGTDKGDWDGQTKGEGEDEKKTKRLNISLSSPSPLAFICPLSGVNSRDLSDKWQKTASIFSSLDYFRRARLSRCICDSEETRSPRVSEMRELCVIA